MRSFGGAAARLVFAAFAVFAFSAAAEAAFITFVASNGNDANPCTVVTAPCKTLQRAVNVVAANGTVRVLTPLQNNAVISKNITISGDGAPIVGIIVINSATAVVTLRGLALNGIGGFANAIRIDSAAAVHIEDCTVERYTNDGIKLVTTAATKLFVLNTVARDNVGDGLYADAVNATAEIENSHFDGNASTGVYLKLAKANVTGSSASRNGQQGFALQSARAKITETAADDNSGIGFNVQSGAVYLNSAEASGNGTGLHTDVGGTAVLSNSMITANVGYSFDTDGTVVTYQNNVLGPYTGNAPQPVSLN